MKLPRRTFLHFVAGATALPAVSRGAWAQAYPTRPVRIVVGVAAGSVADIFARLIGQWLADRLGQPFVIENRPGGGTNIATEAVVRASPDGHTLLLVGAAQAINATLYDKLNFNFLRDIAPVGSIVDSPEAFVVHPSVPAKTIPELVAYAKANPGKLSMASPGVGSGPHMSGELFKWMAGINMTHVPYRGGGLALTDLIAGQVLVTFTAPVLSIEHIRTGKVRALAVTSTTRSHVFPDVPTMAESVPGYRSGAFFGIGAPKATPSDIVDVLNKQINAALAEPGIRARFIEAGVSTLGGSPADFGKFIADETEKWAKVIKVAGIKPV